MKYVKIPEKASIQVAQQLIRSYRQSFRFETATEQQHAKFVVNLANMLSVFRQIRGR